jgi:hypothetical protein
MINILIRLHTNLEKFYKTLNSVYKQTYNNINVIVSIDNKEIYEYICGRKNDYQPIYINPNNLYAGEPNLDIDHNCSHDNKQIFGRLFLPNIYFNILHQYVKPGYIFYLDVGDVILDDNMFQHLLVYIEQEYNILWNVMSKNKKVIPNKWHGYPILCNIDSSNIMFPTKYIIPWTGYRRGDYRVIKEICQKNHNIFVNKLYLQKDFI